MHFFLFEKCPVLKLLFFRAAGNTVCAQGEFIKQTIGQVPMTASAFANCACATNGSDAVAAATTLKHKSKLQAKL